MSLNLIRYESIPIDRLGPDWGLFNVVVEEPKTGQVMEGTMQGRIEHGLALDEWDTDTFNEEPHHD
jgi:hypothetical protein